MLADIVQDGFQLMTAQTAIDCTAFCRDREDGIFGKHVRRYRSRQVIKLDGVASTYLVAQLLLTLKQYRKTFVIRNGGRSHFDPLTVNPEKFSGYLLQQIARQPHMQISHRSAIVKPLFAGL